MTHSTEIVCTLNRYRAWCDCDWSGNDWSSRSDAEDEGLEHEGESRLEDAFSALVTSPAEFIAKVVALRQAIADGTADLMDAEAIRAFFERSA